MVAVLARAKPLVNIQEVRLAYRTLVSPGQVIELRALDATIDHSSYRKTYGGYFDNVVDLARELGRIKAAMGIYITLQELDPDLLHRAKNRVVEQRKDSGTSNSDVLRYRWLPLDCDVKRKAGISSTEEQHKEALAHAQRVKQFLLKHGFPETFEADSGNGAHLLLRIDLPATEETANLIGRVLKGIAEQTDSNSIKLDQSVHNPARIWKLYGTLACKGDDTQERPHRMAQLLSAPQTVMVVTLEQLESIAVPKEQPAALPAPLRKTPSKADPTLEEYLQAHNILYHDVTRDGTLYHILDTGCVFNPDHKGFDAAVFVAASGKWSYHCFHDSCGEKHWKDFRLQIEPDAYSRPKIVALPVPKESYDTLKTAILEAIDKQDVEALYNLAPRIETLETKERALIDAILKTANMKGFSLRSYNQLKKEARAELIEEARARRSDAGMIMTEYLKTEMGMAYLYLGHRRDDEEPIPVRVSNFTAGIETEIITDDGAELSRHYAIQAECNHHPYHFTIPSPELAKCDWIDKYIGAEAYLDGGLSAKSYLVSAIKATSKPAKSYQYTHTGWRKIDGKIVYLHAGQVGSSGSSTSKNIKLLDPATREPVEPVQSVMGQVGQVGQVNSYTVTLNGPLSRYELPPSDNAIQAIRSSLAYLEICSDTLAMPLYASLWRSVLGEVDYGVHLAGQSGKGKTELCALIQQHFGASMSAHRLPGSWQSTENALEMLLFQAKDAVVVVDDFKPLGSRNEQDRLHTKADGIFRRVGNGGTRQRLDATLNQRPERRPRCMLISTGEDIPKGQSLQARGVVLTMTENVTVGEAGQRLTAAQADARSGLYAEAMSGYLAWLAPKIEDIQTKLSDEVADLRTQLSIAGHSRAGTNTANMLLGMRTFIQYAVEVGAITGKEANAYMHRCLRALLSIASDAAQNNQYNKPSEQWRRLLVSAITSKRAHLINTDGSMPGPEYGYVRSIHPRETAEGVIEDITYTGGGDMVGWMTDEDIYLLPEAAYRAARSYGESIGNAITTVEITLRKFLAEDGLLATTDLLKSRRTITVRHRLQGLRQDVLHLKKATLFLDPDGEIDPSDDPLENIFPCVSSLFFSLDPLDPPDPRRDKSALQAASRVGQVTLKTEGGSSPSLDPGMILESHIPAHPAPQEDTQVGQIIDEKNDTPIDPLDPHMTQAEKEVDPTLVEEGEVIYKQTLTHLKKHEHNAQLGRTPKKVMWNGPGTGFERDLIEPRQYMVQAKQCFDSRDPVRIRAAIDAMKRTLGIYAEK